jgi:hypothetical protein
MLKCFAGSAGVCASTRAPEKTSNNVIVNVLFIGAPLATQKNPPSRYDSVSNSAKLSSLLYRNQRFPERRLGGVCLVFEKFICDFQTRNCRLRQVAEKREGFATAKRVRRSFDLGQTFTNDGCHVAGQAPFDRLLV